MRAATVRTMPVACALQIGRPSRVRTSSPARLQALGLPRSKRVEAIAICAVLAAPSARAASPYAATPVRCSACARPGCLICQKPLSTLLRALLNCVRHWREPSHTVGRTNAHCIVSCRLEAGTKSAESLEPEPRHGSTRRGTGMVLTRARRRDRAANGRSDQRRRIWLRSCLRS